MFHPNQLIEERRKPYYRKCEKIDPSCRKRTCMRCYQNRQHKHRKRIAEMDDRLQFYYEHPYSYFSPWRCWDFDEGWFESGVINYFFNS